MTSQRDIMIVGEAFGEEEERQGKPFVGASGRLLHSLLRTVGIKASECHLTNVFNIRPASNKLEAFGGPQADSIPGWPRLANKLYIHKNYGRELDRLFDEISWVKPKLILALGATPLWALCKQLGIKRHRGTPMLTHDGAVKVLPTYHPAAVLRQWTLRPIVMMDLAKAKREAQFAQLRRPERFIYVEPTIEDLWWFHDKYIVGAPNVSADIETKQLSITEIGFAPCHDRCLVVPFYSRARHNYWKTAAEELEAWRFVRHVCETKPLIGQNFSYDIQYLWRTMHIPCPSVADDTMILHHAMYPEMEKSLGFLGSIYTNEPSWKFMRQDAETLKAED